MNKKWIYFLFVPIVVYAFWRLQIDYYDFEMLDNSGNESVVLRIPKSAVVKYPGWSYNRNGPVTIELWYPSLVEKKSVNYWISTSSEIKASKEKPADNDRKLSISIELDRMLLPEHTLDPKNRPPYCDLSLPLGDPYVQEGIVNGFKKYVSYNYVMQRKEASPIPRPYYKKYHPNESIPGVYCISCILNANCRLFGVTASGIKYSAFYAEERMPEEVIEIHNAVQEYISRKVID